MARAGDRALPLSGIVVLDVTRMLPGAVLARQLLDLGARLIKVEAPGAGDTMRLVPPLVDGIGVGFAALLRGADSVALDLRKPDDAQRVRALARRADVLVESFRPGAMEAWGLGSEELCVDNPRLVWCSLSSWGQTGPAARQVGHDLNLMAATGALAELGTGVPGLQIADVSAALLACSAVLAALFERERHGRGRALDQPLASGPLPLLAWAFAEASAGGGGERAQLLSGRSACYRTYRCADGVEVAVGALEPKFWLALVQLLGVPELAGAGYDPGEEGGAAAGRLGEIFASEPSGHWLALAVANGLPVTSVRSSAEALASPELAGLLEDTPVPDGGALRCVGPLFPSLGRTPRKPVGTVGADTERVLKEFGILEEVEE